MQEFLLRAITRNRSNMRGENARNTEIRSNSEVCDCEQLFEFARKREGLIVWEESQIRSNAGGKNAMEI